MTYCGSIFMCDSNSHFINLSVMHTPSYWLLTLREERRLRMFGNRVLKRVFGPKRDEVTGEWRKLHSENVMFRTPYPVLCW